MKKMKRRVQALFLAMLMVVTALVSDFTPVTDAYAAGSTKVTFHYQRTDGEYDDWDLWVWSEGGDGSAATYIIITDFLTEKCHTFVPFDVGYHGGEQDYYGDGLNAARRSHGRTSDQHQHQIKGAGGFPEKALVDGRKARRPQGDGLEEGGHYFTRCG